MYRIPAAYDHSKPVLEFPYGGGLGIVGGVVLHRVSFLFPWSGSELTAAASQLDGDIRSWSAAMRATIVDRIVRPERFPLCARAIIG